MDLDIPGRTWFEAGILSNTDSGWQYDIHKSKTTSPENLVLKKQILQICFYSLLLMCFFGKYSPESFLDTNQCSWIMMATTTMQHPRFMGSVIAWRSRGYDPHIHIINVYVLKIAPTTSLMARLLGARSDKTNRCAFTIVWRNNLQPMTQRQKKVAVS